MHQNRLPRLLGALGLAISLAGGTLFGTAFAAKPAGAMATATAVPSTVSPGGYAAFKIHFENDGPSHISQLDLAADTPSGATYIGVVPPFDSVCSQGGAGTALLCTFGAVNNGQSLDLTVVYQTPSNASGSWTVQFHFNSTGTTTGGNSHGGDIAAPSGTVGIYAASADFAGGFTFGSNLTIGTNTNLGTGNPQSTTVFAPADYIPVTAGELSTGGPPCPASSCLGQWSQVNVNNGATYPGGFKITITISRSVLPWYVLWFWDGDEINIAHVLDNSSVEYIVAEHHQDWCSFDSTGNPTSLPCLTESLDWNQATINVWTTTNGYLRGY
jgi:hypothetical protein